jgi:hypothetical protein
LGRKFASSFAARHPATSGFLQLAGRAKPFKLLTLSLQRAGPPRTSLKPATVSFRTARVRIAPSGSLVAVPPRQTSSFCVLQFGHCRSRTQAPDDFLSFSAGLALAFMFLLLPQGYFSRLTACADDRTLPVL